MFCHNIGEKFLITLLEYQNIKIDTKKSHKINYMRVGARVQSQKSKLKKETKDDTFMILQKSVTPEVHRSLTPHFNVINKYGQKVPKHGAVDYEQHT